VTRRRMPMDWTAWHAVASAGWVAVAALAGTVLVVVGGNDVVGTRIAAAYGVAGIVGWMSNLIVGVSYKLFPGFVAAARTQLGRPAVPMAVLRVPAQLPPIVFAGLNVGVVAIVLGILVDVSPAVLLGGTLLAATGILYAIGTERTLLFTVREPRGEWGPLSVLP
jgi:hypothetical protein